MDNRFKLRAWYRTARHMLTTVRLPTGGDTIFGWYSPGPNSFRKSDYFKANDCVIMQCTGLTDKNGVDIYEGDIVEFGKEKFEVIFADACFWIRGCADKGYTMELHTIIGIGDICVVENIYERIGQ